MGSLSPGQRRQSIAMRPWRAEERGVVWRGASGRFVVALEPAALALLFGLFTLAIAHMADAKEHQGYIYFAWVFGFGAVCFVVYAIALLVYPIRALLQTREPIFIVDGYVRTRAPDERSLPGSSGYIAVVLEDGRTACEWAAVGERPLPDDEYPAFTEFSEFGGIHSVDGRGTGILPEDFPALGVGGARPPKLKP
ncbi:MAG TPA: hypothetical protein VK216_04265 [Magnetospirillaceae bacterium]|nr:hypothetical protein [Magnetospirillaceae bacterium]